MYNNQYQNQGTPYGMPQQQRPANVKMTQPLSDEEMEMLQKNSGPSLKIDPVEFVVSKCTHKRQNEMTLVDSEDGRKRCTICGATFNLVESKEHVDAIVSQINDIMQSIKTYYLTVPAPVIQEFSQIVPLINKIPQLFSMAVSNFDENTIPQEAQNVQYQQYMQNPFFMFNNISNGNFYQQPQQMQGGYQAQPMGYEVNPFQQTGIPPQPQMANPIQQGVMIDNQLTGLAQPVQMPQQQPVQQQAPVSANPWESVKINGINI